jgi:hypothetical protein
MKKHNPEAVKKRLGQLWEEAKNLPEPSVHRPVCPECGHEVDPEVCWCGTDAKNHDAHEQGHSFIPMGCECGRAVVSTVP